MALKAVGIAWYRREDYLRLKEMFTDAGRLPDTFDEWATEALGVWRELTSRGLNLEKAYIDPETFPQWCKARGLEMDERARMDYAREFAAQKVSARRSSRRVRRR